MLQCYWAYYKFHSVAAQLYHSIAVAFFVRPTVCLSHAGIVTILYTILAVLAKATAVSL